MRDEVDELLEAWGRERADLDLAPVAEGQIVKLFWRGKLIFVRHRTAEEIKEAQDVNLASLPDPQPDSARVKDGHSQWLIVYGNCTHLGCVPLGHEGPYHGWQCPCHGSIFDTSGRIRQGPAPTNLPLMEQALANYPLLLVVFAVFLAPAYEELLFRRVLFGRLWAALPAMLLMGAGFTALAFTHDLDQAAMWFAMFAAVIGVGNGLSSGILLTLGADVAPPADPAPFLGSWRTLTDAGGAAAPLLVSGIAAVTSLSVATGAMGVIGLLGALAFVRWVPRFVPRARP